MNKIIYDSSINQTQWHQLNPLQIIKDLLRYRELIASITLHNFKATYQASYLGVAWQVLAPLVMFAIFYFVFGVVLGGRFSQLPIESPLDFALALFIGLSFFNFLAQNIGSAPSLIISHQVYVKNISFPLEIISVTTVLNSVLTLVTNILLALIILLCAQRSIHLSAFMSLYYVVCIFMLTLGISWGLSAVAIFLRDISAIISPITIILMFMCPIFYPLSMVPQKIRWIMDFNPLALIIEDVRGCLLYGMLPSLSSALYVFIISLIFMSVSYFLFMRFKSIFVDLL